MAQYKVPQDVEADDKLLGPLSFRQFIYLGIVAALVAVGWFLAQIFLALAIIPVPFALFFLILALPLRKDQPMETYLAALISFYTKPNKRFWNPGQRESTITIIAPKVVEKTQTKNLSGEEANRRLSFLAGLVDSEGQSLRTSAEPGDFPPVSESPVRSDIMAEAVATTDLFDSYSPSVNAVETEAERTHAAAVAQMRAALDARDPEKAAKSPRPAPTPVFNPATLNTPSIPMTAPEPKPAVTNPRLENLSKNSPFTVATVAKEASRKSKSESNPNEVYIKLH
ncbi:PrgI family protein [Candidatus Saccharibacteria bacterium]|nr:PrgI family protein [Candidatus Saccharibacteria bacterium]